MKELISAWNSYIESMKEMEESWSKFQQLSTEENNLFEKLPEQAQRVLAGVNPHMKFYVALERTSDYIRSHGGLSNFGIIEIEEEEESDE